MENTSTSQGTNGEEIRVRKSYHAPQLIALGEIQSIIQAGFTPGGNDCGVHNTTAAS
jgi:hypothetical protein